MYCNMTATVCGVQQTCGACTYGPCDNSNPNNPSICVCNADPSAIGCGNGFPPSPYVCTDLSTTLLAPTCMGLGNGYWCCP